MSFVQNFWNNPPPNNPHSHKKSTVSGCETFLGFFLSSVAYIYAVLNVGYFYAHGSNFGCTIEKAYEYLLPLIEKYCLGRVYWRNPLGNYSDIFGFDRTPDYQYYRSFQLTSFPIFSIALLSFKLANWFSSDLLVLCQVIYHLLNGIENVTKNANNDNIKEERLKHVKSLKSVIDSKSSISFTDPSLFAIAITVRLAIVFLSAVVFIWLPIWVKYDVGKWTFVWWWIDLDLNLDFDTTFEFRGFLNSETMCDFNMADYVDQLLTYTAQCSLGNMHVLRRLLYYEGLVMLINIFVCLIDLGRILWQTKSLRQINLFYKRVKLATSSTSQIKEEEFVEFCHVYLGYTGCFLLSMADGPLLPLHFGELLVDLFDLWKNERPKKASPKPFPKFKQFRRIGERKPALNAQTNSPMKSSHKIKMPTQDKIAAGILLVVLIGIGMSFYFVLCGKPTYSSAEVQKLEIHPKCKTCCSSYRVPADYCPQICFLWKKSEKWLNSDNPNCPALHASYGSKSKFNTDPLQRSETAPSSNSQYSHGEGDGLQVYY